MSHRATGGGVGPKMQTQKPTRTQAPPKQRLDTRGLGPWERKLAEQQAAAGRHGRRGHRCPACRGKGQVPGMIKTQGKGMGSAFGPCPECGGSGYVAGTSDESP